MNNPGTKILNIIFSEVVGALIFIFFLIVASMLPGDDIGKQITNIIIGLWIFFGIATPIVIFLELEDQIFTIFKGLNRR